MDKESSFIQKISSYDPARKKFFNPHIQDEKRSLKDVLLWRMGFFNDRSESVVCPTSFASPLVTDPIDPKKPTVTWINHSTFLIKMDGLHFLTDPIWSQRCSPFSFLGPKRRHDPPLKLSELKQVDHVLISHNHYDHLDKNTVKILHELYPNIQWWVPLGVKKWFTSLGITKVKELSWWESFDHDSIRFTAVPTQHFSGRSFKDLDASLWSGFVVESLNPNGKRFYFVGDTGYNPFDFKEIGKKWLSMDLSLIPIGTYVPRKFMSPVHINPFEAVQIHKEVFSKKSIGMHWKTFRLSDEEEFRPAYDLVQALQKEKIRPTDFLALPPGYEINW